MKRQDARDATELREPDEDLDQYASAAVDAAIEAHRELEPASLESVYAGALLVGPGTVASRRLSERPWG